MPVPVGTVLRRKPGTGRTVGTTPIAEVRQWMRGETAIPAADGDTYTTVNADGGEQVRLRLTSSNIWGSSVRLSAPIEVDLPTAVAPTNDVLPVLGGTVSIGASPTVTPGVWSGTEPITYLYTLRRDGVDITGLVDVSEATIEAYEYVAADIGPSITLAEQATNGAGTATAVSNAVAWYPTQWSGLRGLYDAATGVTLVSGDVDEWDDVSGSGNPALAGLAIERASLAASGFNGGTEPYVEFDGADEWLGVAAFGWGGAPVAATCVAALHIVTPTNGRVVMRYGGLGNRPAINELTTQRVNWLAFTSTSQASATGAFLAPRALIASAAAGGTKILRVLGTTPPADQTDGTDAHADGAPLGIGASQVGTVHSHVRVAMLVIRNAATTTGEVADWQAYAAWRWGL